MFSPSNAHWMTVTHRLTLTNTSPIVFLFSSGFDVMQRSLVTRVLELGSRLSMGIVVVPYRNWWLALITATQHPK